MKLGHAVFAGCCYETVALLPGSPLPTITRLVWRARGAPIPVYVASVVAIVGGLGVAAFHLLLQGWEE